MSPMPSLPAAPARPARHRARLVVVALAAVLLAAACSGQQKTPTDYNSGVKQNFLQGCERPQSGQKGVSSKDQIKNSRQECTCVYDQISKTIPFSEFKKVYEDQSDTPSALPSQILKIIEGCTSSG